MFIQPIPLAIHSLLSLFAITSTAAVITQKRNVEQIKDIDANITLFDKRVLQLKVGWNDNLPKGTSYNVIVTPANLTKCPDLPCSIYGATKPKNYMTIPESPMSNVDEMDCNYMFGCDYILTVETSNAMVSRSKNITIPYCVMDVCSCRHAPTLPKVLMAANVPANDTISFYWSIKLKDVHEKKEANGLMEMKLSNIHLKIAEQTNPSLSWGGILKPIAERTYSLRNTSNTTLTEPLQGNVKIKLGQQLADQAVLNLHSYIIDEFRCTGPANLIKVQVPTFNKIAAISTDGNSSVTVTLVVAALLLVCVVVSPLPFCIWRRYKRRKIKKAGQCLSTFGALMDMEDNINYVDKYVEEAQAKGLADIFEIPHHTVHLEEEIGEGAFGRVYRAVAVNLRRMRGTTIVAVKQLKRNPTADEIAEFLAEIEMLKGVGTHNNIVCFLGCCTIRPPYLMVMEYVGHGDLLSYLRRVRQEKYTLKPGNVNYSSRTQSIPKPTIKYIELKHSNDRSVESENEVIFSRQPKPSVAETTYTMIDDEEYNEPFEYILDHKELHSFALQIANGMRFLEKQDITHRDLAARNVLIDDRKILKISDFGLSRHGIYTNTKTRKLPLRWLSLEAIRDNVYSCKSDVWAYGVVLWEIGTLGASPYPTISNHELIPYLISGKRLEKPGICTDQLYAIMMQCWDEDPTERPTFEELHSMLNPKTAYIDINSLSDDYVFPPIKEKDKDGIII